MVESYPPGGANVHLPCDTFPWANQSPQPKQHLNRFSRVCTAHGRKALCFPNGPPVPLPPPKKNAHPIHGSLGTPESTTQTASRTVQPILLKIVTDRLTDFMLLVQVSVAISRIYVCSTAMRPKNCFRLNIPNKKSRANNLQSYKCWLQTAMGTEFA